ncbi:unnamed protein product [Urochloa decumbens]|uniref:Protein SCAR n=1 Tax=Urochloa decumbens TaxID=240449 RepID=A0ABC9ENZ3_9POAL
MAATPRPRPSSSGSTPAVNEAAMAGLVAILRHLGDLAELAAEVFDGLQDQAVAVSARAQRLKARAKQLQADLDRNGHRRPLCQAPTRRQQRLNKVSHGVVSVAGGEAPPRSIVNHIKRCRGPPRLSALDRFDAHGDGACLKRYTNPSFFRAAHSQNACSANHLHQADSDDTRSQTDDSENKSLGFLSMLRRRQLKHRQTAGSVSCPSLKLQTCTHKSSHSDVEMDKANRNHPSTSGQSKDSATSNCCSDAAGSDYVGSCSELQRTGSFEAWLSPGARFGSSSIQDSAPVSEESYSHQETTDSSKVDAPPLLLPIPPMQWLSVKVHTGPVPCYRNPFGKDHVQRAGGKILKNTVSSCGGNTVSDSKANKHYSNATQSQVDVQSSASGTGESDENVFFSAMEQLARTSPPWMPSHPLLEVASCDRITLRNGPSPLHGSRSILDCRTTLLEQIKDKAHADSNHAHSD